MGTITKYYEDCWYKVEYDIDDNNKLLLCFKAYKIQGLDPTIELSECDSDPCLVGTLKWDGCMEFKHNEHYCGVMYANQTCLLIKIIYEYADRLDNFDVY